MKPKSENLFHFTKSLNTLKLILKGGIQPRYCLEDIEWIGSEPEGHVAYAMSSFCDIPLARVSDHTDFYGKYGIGLTKQWGLRNNLNPVVYITNDGIVKKHINYLLSLKSTDESLNNELITHKVNLIKLVKPLSGKMLINGKTQKKIFYQENEWRYLPNNNSIIIGSNYEKEKDEGNEKAKEYTLQFEPNDIKYIFVKTDEEIPILFDFINNYLDKYSLNDLKILQSRIISLSTIVEDI